MFSKFLLILGIAIFGYACRTFQTAIVRKIGMLAFLAATFVLFHALTGSVLAGAASMLLWFFLPWIELLTRVRRMDLPIDKPLRPRMPQKDEVPFLESVTEEIEDLAVFRQLDDWGYEWQGTEHFFRLFYDPESRTQAAICLTREETFTHAYVKLVSRSQKGKVYTTWNYPFSATLKLSPEQLLQWDRTSDSFEGIYQSHLKFLEDNGISLDEITQDEPEEFLELLQRDQRRLVDHNMAMGVLKVSGEGMCRYTWRGLVFLWTQLVKDMVRLH